MMTSSASLDLSENVVNFDKRALKLDTKGDATEIIDSINEHSGSMRTLILSGNTLGIEAGEAIGKSLETHKELSIALWSDMFTGRSKAIIAPALAGLSKGVIISGAQLVELDLRDNAFGPTGVVGVTELIGSRCCQTLKILRMDNEGLGHQGCRLLSDALTKCLDESEAGGKLMQLEVFSAGRNRLENEGMKMLSNVFQRMKSLQELTLNQNGIGIHGIDGCEALSQALSENRNLKILNISDNSLTPKGIRVLADCAFEHLDKLEVLNLSDCILRSKGARILAECMNEMFPSLQELYVSGNEIRRDSAVNLILSLDNQRNSLKIFDLNSNELGEDGIIDVQETLASLELGHCLQSLSDDDGCDDDEDEENHDEDTYEEYEDDDDEDEEEDDEEEDDENEETEATTSKGGQNFSFKTPNQSKPTSLFEGLPICSPNNSISLFPCNTESLFDSSSKSSSLFSSPNNQASLAHSNASAKPSFALAGVTRTSAPERSLFSDPALSQTKPTSLFENSTSSSLFKTPANRPATGIFGSPAASSTNGSSGIMPARLFSSVTQEIDVNREVKQLLQSSQPSPESVKRLSSVSDLRSKVGHVLQEDSLLLEAAVECCVEVACQQDGDTVCQALLDAAIATDATVATNHVLVQLGLIKGEKKMTKKINSSQYSVFLTCIKNCIAKNSVPRHEAELISLFLSKGPPRTEAAALLKQHKSEIDLLSKTIQEGLAKLKV